MWGNEIAVAFKQGIYKTNAETHSIDRSQGQPRRISRSLDGGQTWQMEEPVNFDEGELSPPPHPVDFTNPDFAIRCNGGGFRISYDRARTWQGPYPFPDFGFEENLTPRTDVINNGTHDCHFFLSVRTPEVRSKLADRSFCVRTRDGGRTFSEPVLMLLEPREVRSVMSSSVRISEKHIVSSLRRRVDHERDGKFWRQCWIDIVDSEDNGESWRFLGKLADTDTFEEQHNGNPPSLVRLRDGRLCGIYGYRAPPFGMRAKVSSDNGHTWSEEIVLRDDARTWDIGYPKSVVRPDGQIVSTYYYTTEENVEQQIAATIWHPDEIS
jgi:hypothetical protein